MATLLELRARIARDAEMYEPLTLLDLTAAALAQARRRHTLLVELQKRVRAKIQSKKVL
jgi:hypothetical protein